MHNPDWHFDLIAKNDDDKGAETSAPKTQEEVVDQLGVRTSLLVLCIALFIAAVWIVTSPSFEKCSALENAGDRNACYGELRKNLFKPPAKGANFAG